jgi:hypothetical protein
MGWFVSDDRVPVVLGCLCPGTPHDHDTVNLRAELGPAAGFAAVAAIQVVQKGESNIEEQLGRIYAEHGILDWTFVDEDGNPVEPSLENIRRLTWDAIYPIAAKGDDLYAESLLRPLLARLSASSPNGRTARSTSAKPRTSRTRKQ